MALIAVAFVAAAAVAAHASAVGTAIAAGRAAGFAPSTVFTGGGADVGIARRAEIYVSGGGCIGMHH